MSGINLKNNRSEIIKFLDSFDTVVIVCDGVLWWNHTLVPNVTEVISAFKDLKKKTFYMTSNNTITRKELVQKFINLKFPVTEDEILCNSQKVVRYLKNQGFEGKVYVIGNSSIAEELENAGIPYYGIGLDPIVNIDTYFFNVDRSVKAVIVGHDEHFSFRKMLKAATYLKDPKVLFIGNNTRQSLPTDCNSFTECEGIIHSIEECTGRKSELLEKPTSDISKIIGANRTINPKNTLIISNRADIDIRFGNQRGFKTLFISSGTSIEDVETWKVSLAQDKNLIPHYYIDSLGNLHRELKLMKHRKQLLTKQSTKVK